MHGLIHAAVADRPVEDVVRLITLLERSPEPARMTADALRAVAVDRSVEDVTRLVQLLHLSPVEPHCAEAAVRAVAVHRPVEELAELIGRLAAERDAGEAEAEPARAEVGPLSATAEPVAVPDPQDRAAGDRLQAERALAVAGSVHVPAPEGSATAGWAVTEGPATVGRSVAAAPVKTRRFVIQGRAKTLWSGAEPSAERRPAAADRAGNGRTPTACLWAARCAALLVFLCGMAHAPRSWTGLSHGVLGATLLASALCGLLALALTARAAPARLVAATAAVGVTAVLAAGHVLGGRFNLPDPARLRAATLAPPWLAGPMAAAAALGALVVLLTALTMGNAERGNAG
ncbi:membrane protein [Streptomyces sp. NRRL WC-3723]|nr:membrane protein [Streptomyces sp. NRRL WC-3723]